MDVRIRHPAFGTVWLSNIRIVQADDRWHVEGHVFDDHEDGVMNFPLGCVAETYPATCSLKPLRGGIRIRRSER